ncbi:hypothetical protein [Pseudoclavibacter helvolus]
MIPEVFSIIGEVIATSFTAIPLPALIGVCAAAGVVAFIMERRREQ